MNAITFADSERLLILFESRGALDGGRINYKSVPDIAFDSSFIRFVNLLGIDHLNVAKDIVLSTKI